MIDWLNLFFSAVWLGGCALALATLSIANFEAREKGARLRDRLKQPRVLAVLAVAAILFGAGMFGTSQSLFERIAWVVLTLAVAIVLIGSLRVHQTT